MTRQAPLPEPKEGDPEGPEKVDDVSELSVVYFCGCECFADIADWVYTMTGRNDASLPDFEPPSLGMVGDLPMVLGMGIVALGLIFTIVGRKRAALGWHHGKGLVPPSL